MKLGEPALLTLRTLTYVGLAGWIFWRSFSKFARSTKPVRRYAMRALVFLILGLAAADYFVHQKPEAAYQAYTRFKESHGSWQRYDFKEAGFSALFPGTPEFVIDKPKTDPTDDGAVQPLKYLMHLTNGDSDYRVVVTILPEGEPIALDMVLSQALSLAKANPDLQLLNQTPVAVAGTRGIDLLLKSKDGDMIRMRLFLSGQKYFRVIAVVPPEAVSNRETEDFLDSVQLLSDVPLGR